MKLYSPVAILSFIVFFVLYGCMSTHKAVDYLKKKDKLSEVCAESYPVDTTTTIKVDTVYKSDTVFSFATDSISYISDSDYYQIDTAFHQQFVVYGGQRDCPTLKTVRITKTVFITKTITQTDKAKLAVKDKAIADRDKTIIKKDITISRKDRWRKIALWSLATNMVVLIYLFRGAIGKFIAGSLSPIISKIKNS